MKRSTIRLKAIAVLRKHHTQDDTEQIEPTKRLIAPGQRSAEQGKRQRKERMTESHQFQQLTDQQSHRGLLSRAVQPQIFGNHHGMGGDIDTLR